MTVHIISAMRVSFTKRPERIHTKRLSKQEDTDTLCYLPRSRAWTAAQLSSSSIEFINNPSTPSRRALCNFSAWSIADQLVSGKIADRLVSGKIDDQLASAPNWIPNATAPTRHQLAHCRIQCINEYATAASHARVPFVGCSERKRTIFLPLATIKDITGGRRQAVAIKLNSSIALAHSPREIWGGQIQVTPKHQQLQRKSLVRIFQLSQNANIWYAKSLNTLFK